MSKRLQVNVTGALLATLLMWASAPPESPVADAAMRGDVAQVRTLLRGGADVNAAQGDGMTALHWAAENGSAELAEMLLYASANAAAVTRLGDYTPLHLAGKTGSASVVQVLLGGGADPHAATSTGGVTPLHFAGGAGVVESVSLLLEHGASVDARETMWHQTPLMFAAAAGRVGVVEALQGGNVLAGRQACLCLVLAEYSHLTNPPPFGSFPPVRPRSTPPGRPGRT